MTPAEEYRQRAIEFFDLAAKSDDPEEREALATPPIYSQPLPPPPQESTYAASPAGPESYPPVGSRSSTVVRCYTADL
jgi:hypothetical protein